MFNIFEQACFRNASLMYSFTNMLTFMIIIDLFPIKRNMSNVKHCAIQAIR